MAKCILNNTALKKIYIFFFFLLNLKTLKLLKKHIDILKL